MSSTNIYLIEVLTAFKIIIMSLLFSDEIISLNKGRNDPQTIKEEEEEIIITTVRKDDEENNGRWTKSFVDKKLR